jgi:predicted amidohydrolase YtcJ
VQDAALRPHELDHYLALADARRLPCGVAAALIADPSRWEGQVDELVATRDRCASLAVRAGTIKLFADGIIEAGTASLVDPYCDCAVGAGGHHGIPTWPADELARAVVAFDALGFQVHIHAIGDAGVRAALDAVAAADAVNGRRDRRPIIAHTQLVQPNDLPRFAALGVIANFEPLWAQRDALMIELTEPRLGPERSAWQYPMGSLLRGGAALSFGSDWPVSSYAPLDGLAVAATRQTRAGEPEGGWLPDQRLALDEALAAYTVGTAHQAFADDGTGRLALGAPADLCFLAADPGSVAPHDLPELTVLGTWTEGREVFRR